MKALVGAFNQEKALVGAFSVIVKTNCETDGSFYSTNLEVVDDAELDLGPRLAPHPRTLSCRGHGPGGRQMREICTEIASIVYMSCTL